MTFSHAVFLVVSRIIPSTLLWLKCIANQLQEEGSIRFKISICHGLEDIVLNSALSMVEMQNLVFMADRQVGNREYRWEQRVHIT